jgi:hypothetical protein
MAAGGSNPDQVFEQSLQLVLDGIASRLG